MGFQETVLGTPGQAQVHQAAGTKPPGFGMARDVYATLMRLMESGTPFPTYQGNLDPGLSPTLQNSLRMAQGYAGSSPQEALAGVNGSIGRFMNPNYSNPSGSPGQGLGGSMPSGGGGPTPPWAPSSQGGPQMGRGGQRPGMSGGGMTPPPMPQGGGGMSMGGMMGPNVPAKPPGGFVGGAGGGGWGAPGGQSNQSPPWAPPQPQGGGPGMDFKGGGRFPLGGGGQPPPYTGPPNLPYGNDGRPMQIPGPPQGVPQLSWPGGQGGLTGMPSQPSWGTMAGGQPGIDPVGPPPQATQGGYPGGDIMAYLRTFLQNQQQGGGAPQVQGFG
jgi:hypothetical protein